LVPTTIHLPDELLSRVDERAKTLKITRNRYIVEALRKALAQQSEWSPDFLDQLSQLKPIEGVDELLHAIKKRRTRKAPPRL
jgi:predicted DNA-binding protein